MKLFVTLLVATISQLASAKFQIYLKDYQSPRLSQPRNVFVYTPKNYTPQETYPVVFMHDGQNLFDPQRAFQGRTWKVQESLDRLIENGQVRPVVVVAIDNTPDRLEEYIWERMGESYLDFISEELLPLLESDFSLKRGPEHRAMIGSSLGGLISLRAGLHRHFQFGLIAALSPSIWWNNKEIINLYRTSPNLPQKIYIDMGSRNGERPEDVRQLQAVLQSRSHPNLYGWIDELGGHDEAAWAYRFPMALKFLFPPN